MARRLKIGGIGVACYVSYSAGIDTPSAGTRVPERTSDTTGAGMIKVMVTAKRVADPGVKIFPLADGSGADLARVRMTLNPFDEIAAEQAARWRKSGVVSELLAVSVGPRACEEVLRHCFAMGADRAVLAETDAPLIACATARVLAEIARKEQPDLILMGKQSTDGEHHQTAQITAALLGWPMAAYCSVIELHPEQAALTVVREVDDGLSRARLTFPAVCTADLRLCDPRRPSLPEVMRSRSKTVERFEMIYPSEDYYPELLGVEEAPKRKRGVRVKDAQELFKKLTEAGVL